MRCNRCGFENLPGLTACMRCASVLVVTDRPSVTPPRAGWTKRFRPVVYWVNRHLRLEGVPHLSSRTGATINAAVRGFLHQAASPARDFPYAVVSIVPGLGHLLQGRLREIRWLWPAWLLALLVGGVLYGTNPGNVLVGLAMALHAIIICDAGRFRDHIEHPVQRIIIVLLVFFLLVGLFYCGLVVTLHSVRASAPLPGDSVVAGDRLLFRARNYERAPLERGDIVLYALAPATVGRAHLRGGDVVGKVLGLPGETLTFSAGTMSAASRDGTKLTFIAPSELSALQLQLTVPEGHAFCLPPPVTIYEANLGAPPREDVIRATGLVRTSAIYGRLFMVYNPILRCRWTHGRPLETLPEPSDEPIRQSGIRGASEPEKAASAE